ncbi:MAG: DUF5915 domain-containing protein, partial [Pseudomonadales bacterium]
VHRGNNILDRWIIARLQTLKQRVGEEMEAYRLYNVVPQLFSFIEDLTNWYIRLNRQRFWGEAIDEHKIAAYSTLYDSLLELSTVMAPFTPFLAEHLYRELSSMGARTPSPLSVHLCDFPEADVALQDADLELAVDRMQQVILLGRQRREEVKINLRTPLRTLTVIHRDQALLDQLQQLEGYLRSELNVLEVRYDSDESRYIQLVAKPNFPRLGKRLGKRMKSFAQQIQSLTLEQIGQLQESGSIEIDGEQFDSEDIEVRQQVQEGADVVSNSQIALSLDTELDEELIRGGLAREIVNRVQRARKDLGFNVSDRIHLHYDGHADVLAAAAEHLSHISKEVLSLDSRHGLIDSSAAETVTTDIDGQPFLFQIVLAPAASAGDD